MGTRYLEVRVKHLQSFQRWWNSAGWPDEFSAKIMGSKVRRSEPRMDSPHIAGGSVREGRAQAYSEVSREKDCAAQRAGGTYIIIDGKEETVDLPIIIFIFHNQA